jgi:MFS family permease
VQLALDTEEPRTAGSSFWRSPAAWLREKNLSSSYWQFFNAAFFFDSGFSVYVFLFNLYLLDFHFNERAIGLINGALTLGSVVGTLPVGALGRRFGVRPLLLFCFVAAPLLGIARTLWMWEPAQIALAFLAGLAMSTWGVSFLPAVARLTTVANRTAAMSLIFSVGVGSSALGGAICGYLPQWLRAAGLSMQPFAVKRLILIASSAIAAAGIFAVLRLRMPPATDESAPEQTLPDKFVWLRGFHLNPFLWRFLLSMALWTIIIAAFAPFANVYLARDLHIPLVRIGLIFSVAQIVQLLSGFFIPYVLRKLGMLNGILATQLAAALTLAAMATATHQPLAIALYLTYSAAQWMSAPGLYNLLMNETPDAERSTAAAMTMFTNALVSSAATVVAGILFTKFGYTHVLVAIAASAAGVGLLSRLLFSGHNLTSSPARQSR